MTPDTPQYPPLLLASQSPRRRELLTLAGIPFRVEVRPIEEDFPADLAPHLVPEYLAQKKAAAFAGLITGELVLTCDTVVILDDEVINKPTDEADAIRMLTALSGRVQTVVSGVCLTRFDAGTGLLVHQHTFREHTDVHFRPLSPAFIRHYVHAARPLDKAGAYGIQDALGLVAVSRVEGCFYNVMGLPVSRLVGEMVDLKFNL
jgi:septum formation protein